MLSRPHHQFSSRHYTEIATRLPRLPDATDFVVIRKEDVDLNRHVDFMVRREKVKAALEYKITHDPNYADLIIDHDVLRQLPENGSVADRIPSCCDRVQNRAALPVGPGATADHGERENEDELVVGGVMDLTNLEQPELEQVRHCAAQAIAGPRYERTVVSFHNTHICHKVDALKINAPNVDPAPLSESKPGYMTMAFPKLFPDGAGDSYQARLRKVDVGEYFKHLLRFRGGRFAQHRRFPWFAFNTLQWARTRSRSKVFVKQQRCCSTHCCRHPFYVV
jgi:hypothetical protein